MALAARRLILSILELVWRTSAITREVAFMTKSDVAGDQTTILRPGQRKKVSQAEEGAKGN